MARGVWQAIVYGVTRVRLDLATKPPYILYIYIFFFHHGLLQDTEYGSLCYTVGPCYRFYIQ